MSEIAWLARRPPAASLALGAALLLASASSAGAQQPLTERAEVLAVEIPVRVERKGEPVRDLTAADFEVIDQGRSTPIVDFEVVDLGRLVAQLDRGEVTLPTTAARKFLLLFDLTFSRPASIARARHAAFELVANRLTPLDLAAVATYSSTGGARAVIGFTSDREELRQALENLGLHQPLESFSNPLTPLVADLQRTISAAARGNPTTNPVGFDRKGLADEIFLENLLDASAYIGRVNRQALEDHVLDWTESLEELARSLDGVEGTKQIVLFSEGFDGTLLRGTADERRSAELAEQSARGEVWRIDSNERFGFSTTRSGLSEMLAQFKRSGSVIHTVDAGGLRAAEGQGPGPSRGEDSLFLMARETGGTFFHNLNDLDQAMERLLAATAYSYLLVIQPQGVPLDGEYHRLKVKLKKKVRGARLAHRPGYHALAPTR